MIDPAQVITVDQPLVLAIDAYKAFDERRAGWMKVKLEPASAAAYLPFARMSDLNPALVV